MKARTNLFKPAHKADQMYLPNYAVVVVVLEVRGCITLTLSKPEGEYMSYINTFYESVGLHGQAYIQRQSIMNFQTLIDQHHGK